MPLPTAFLYAAGTCPAAPSGGSYAQAMPVIRFVPDALGEGEYSDSGQNTALQKLGVGEDSLWAMSQKGC